MPCLSPTEQLIAAIEAALAVLPPGPAIVGYSGGMDSSLLLHCAARSERVRGRGLRALHVHHVCNNRTKTYALNMPYNFN